MVIHELYSTRKKRLESTGNDVFQYEELPMNLRNQIVNIINLTGERVGKMSKNISDDLSSSIVGILRHELGVTQLVKSRHSMISTVELYLFVRIELDIDNVLDAIELTFTMLERYFERRHLSELYMSFLKEQIFELNYRFRECGVGYQYENHQIIRIDNTFIHSEAVKPALKLLSDPSYKAAEVEFLTAYGHFRERKNKDAILNAGKALESTMKVICDKQGWQYSKQDTAKRLIEICFKNELINPMMQSFWGGLQSILESGTPTIRNREAGHGGGSELKQVPDYIVSYVLHMTASSIVMLVNAEKAFKSPKDANDEN